MNIWDMYLECTDKCKYCYERPFVEIDDDGYDLIYKIACSCSEEPIESKNLWESMWKWNKKQRGLEENK